MTAWTLANVGSPLLFLSVGHLYLGNLLIGWLEGSLISRWLGVPRTAAITWMIVANYMSAVVGAACFLWLGGQASEYFGETLRGGELRAYVAWVVSATFLLTCVIEFPLFVVSAVASPGRWSVRLRAHIGAQATSYAFMLLLYWWISPMSLAFEARFIEHPHDILRGDQGWVYYVHDRNGELWRMRLDGSRKEAIGARVSVVDRSRFSCKLFARPRDGGGADIVWGRDEFVTSTPGLAAPRPSDMSMEATSYNQAVEYPPAAVRAFSVQAGNFLESRVSFYYQDGEHAGTGRRRDLSLRSPIISWDASTPTILPHGGVVAQFGPYLLLMNERFEVFCLGRGKCPAVVLDAPVTSPDSESPLSPQTP